MILSVASKKVSFQHVLYDCLFLCAVQLFFVVLYVSHLGFYSDDWTLLAIYTASPDQSPYGLFKSVYTSIPGAHCCRPGLAAYLSVLYWLYGLNPLGYHITNAFVWTLAIVLFYLVIRELGASRSLALIVPLVYSVLPHYSTDRFWYATFQANLSVALYFLSLFANLKTVQANGGPGRFLWILVAIVSMIGSGLAYEMVFPLFVLNLAIIWYKGRRAAPEVRTAAKFQLASQLMAGVAIFMFKYFRMDRPADGGLLERLVHYRYYRNIKAGLHIHFGSYGIALPLKIFRILRDYPHFLILVFGVLLGITVFVYLYRHTTSLVFASSNRTAALILMALGLLVFVLGYCAYLPLGDPSFVTTGAGNRTAIAAAIGVAIFFVGAITFVSSILRFRRLNRLLFCLMLSLVCAAGFIINNTLASFWVSAYARQREVVADITTKFPSLPQNAHLILDGVCPYIGPGVVFENLWDLAGSLQVHYRSPVHADVFRPRLTAGEEGLSSYSYGVTEHRPYGENLFVYDFGEKQVYKLIDAPTAKRYFAARRNVCPAGSEGAGVEVF
jgi:hypothetical protein